MRIIAHSMGGLVARTMQLEAPATWRRMMAHPDARLLMLGTPNGGSWAPMQTLSGDDTFGNALVAFGALFDKGGARKMMAGMPGFMQLQDGLLDPQLGLDRAETWQKLADQDIAILRERSFWHQLESQISIYTWGAPPQKVLDQAVALRRRLDAQIGQLGLDKQKMLLVVGHASFTPAGIRLDPNDGLEYLDTPDDGDGRVTLASSTQLGLRTWKLDAEHGKLPDVAEAFAAYVELLQTGDTRSLEPLEARTSRAAGTASTAGGAAAAAAASPQLQRSRPSRGLQASLPPSDAGDVMGLARHSAKRVMADQGSRALQMTVLNADLRFVQQPLLVGHYRSMTLTGAEEVIDALVNQGMSRALAAGLYPDAVGSHQIFGNQRPHPDNPFQMARPQAAIVVGLGEEGKLRTSELIFTVRQAVMAYAQRLSEQATGAAGSETPAPLEFELAATLIGSGGTGITTGAAAQAIAQGAWAAKQKLQGTGWPQLSRLTLTELYLDRAGDAWRALQQLEAASPGSYKLVGKVSSGPGAMRRMLDSNYRGSNYDFISALSVPGHKPDQPAIAYKLNTKRARSELREQHAQGALLREFVARASNDANTDTQIGRTLFNLLIPVEMEPFLGGSSELVIELEPATAGIPWELLNTNPLDSGEDKRPWAIRTKLIRKLQLDDYRAEPRDASADDHVLVIGEPLCDPTLYPRLEGARQEALAVAEQLSSGLGRETNRDGTELVNLLAEQNDAQTIINALFERNYRAIHIAGHGAPGPEGGVVLSGQNTYLSAAEVKSMRVVPELVFLNCCHLAGRDPNAVLQTETGAGRYDRASFAANTAEALIKVGVRCV
ncbi:MAG: CHAT domain-containing protein, partial [Burkholderiaceae bacterium]|nr:CHAT domain-containing protein [Burkholderiaceae bacterium]